MFTDRAVGVALIISALSCGSAPSRATDPVGSASASRASDLITASELANPSVSNGDALEAVRRLRPRFLATRGAGSIRNAGAGSVRVSIDGGPLVTLSILSRMRAAEIAEIRHLSASEAAQRFGTSAASLGVLLVKSK